MELNNGRIQSLDQELKKLSEIVLRLAPLAQQELLRYRTIETQHSQLLEINKQLQEQNSQAQENIQKAVETSNIIANQTKDEANKVRADMAILWSKAYAKFKEIEKQIEDADRKSIKANLKQLETMAA